MSDGVIRIVQVTGQVVVCTPDVNNPSKFTVTFEDGSSVVERITEAFNSGNVKKK